MTIKKFAIAALTGASMIAAVSSAQAATITSPAGMTFTVSAACTLTGSVANLGTYSVTDTQATYASRQGALNTSGQYVTGTDTPKQLASLTCPTGTAWFLNIAGTGQNNGAIVLNPTNVAAFSTIPTSATVGGAANVGFLNTGGNGINGTGTGAAQVVNGYYAINETDPLYVATSALVQGQYNATATATLTF